MPRRCYTVVLFLLISLALSSCALIEDFFRRLDTSTIFYYTPVTYCNGLYDPEGSVLIGREPVLVEEVFVYRIDSVQNNQDTAVSLYPGYFFARLADTRLATRAAQRLTTLPIPLAVAASGRVEMPGLIAIRYYDAGRTDLIQVEPGSGSSSGELGYRVSFPALQYDPSLTGGDRPYIGINTRGVHTRIVDSRPCRRDEVIALARTLR